MSLNHITFNKPSVLFVIFIWPQESTTTSKLHSSLSNLETGCSSPSLAAAIFSLALLNASSTEFTLGKELMMMMEAVGIMASVMMVKVCHLEKRVAELSRSIKNFRLSRLLVTLPPTKKAFA